MPRGESIRAGVPCTCSAPRLYAAGANSDSHLVNHTQPRWRGEAKYARPPGLVPSPETQWHRGKDQLQNGSQHCSAGSFGSKDWKSIGRSRRSDTLVGLCGFWYGYSVCKLMHTHIHRDRNNKETIMKSISKEIKTRNVSGLQL